MALQSGVPIPEKIQNAPQLEIGLEFFYNAWAALDSCRSSGWGEGPIPWTAINQYCITYDITGDLLDDVFYHVRLLDNEYLKWKSAKREIANKPKKGKHK